MQQASGHSDRNSGGRRRRGRPAIGTSIDSLPKSTQEQLVRLATTSTLPVTEIDTRLGLTALGVGISALQKHVSRLRTTIGMGAMSAGRNTHRARIEMVAAGMLIQLTGSLPEILVDAAIRRLAYLRHIDTDEIASLAARAAGGNVAGVEGRG